jgi:hypothetical protein
MRIELISARHMSITPNHLILVTLQDLSRAASRASARDPSKDFTRVIPNPSKAYALGGLSVATSGKDAPASVGKMLGTSTGVHEAVGRAYDNPGIRFGDRSKGSARPLSADGAQSFHFKHSYFSKTSPILELIEAARGGRRYTNSNATDHLLYIERDGAAEKVGKEKEYPGYDPDVEFDGLEWDAAGRSAKSQQDYLERLGTVERTPLHDLSDDELDKLEYASFGNIGDTIEERRQFWNALERVEQDPQGDEVKIKFADYPEWWGLAIQNMKSAPTQLRKMLEAQAATGEPADFSKKLPTKAALEIHNWVASLDPEAPIEIVPGRGGRIQNRIIAELPFELEGRERVEIVRNFTKKLTEKRLPVWAVIHAPDDNNDERNYHVHVVYADRPAARMRDPKSPDGPEVWDFEIQDVKTYKSRNRRVFHPYIQNKLPEVSVGRESDTWVPILRERWKDVSNEVMEKAGVIKRYDARSYEAMGIQVDPLNHIPSKTFNRERKGELTADGVVLARRQWQVMQDRLVDDHRKRAQHRQRKLKQKTDKAREIMSCKSPYRDIALKEVDRLTKLVVQIGWRVSVNELFQDLSRLVIDRVASRPKLIIHADKKRKEKSQDPTKSKRGKGHGQTTQASEEQGGATQSVGPVAKEASTFLLEIFTRGVQMDHQNGQELRDSRFRLSVLLKRLDNMMADPKRHPLDRSAPGLVDLEIVDPAPEVARARKQERMERITGQLNAYLEATQPKIPAEISGRSPAKPEESKENIPQGSVSAQRPASPTSSVTRDLRSTGTAAARAPIQRSTADRPTPPNASAKPATPQPATAKPVETTASAHPQSTVARPQKTRFRPESFYKPKENAVAPAEAQAKNTAPGPVNSPAPNSAKSAPKAAAPNNSRAEAANKPAVAENSRQASKPAVNNGPKPENTALGTKPARDNSGSVASKPATPAPAPSAPAQAQRPAAAPTDTRSTQTQTPRRGAQAPAAPAARPTTPQAGSPKEPATANFASAPAANPAKTPPPSPASAQTPAPRPEPARQASRAETSAGKPDATKAAHEAKGPARPERASVAPKPSTAESGPARTPGERSGESSAAKPAKEKAEIRVGNPLSTALPKQMEPIRVEGKKPPKKPKRRGSGKDDGRGL